MNYRYMHGMGTAEEATQLVAQAREADSRNEFLTAAALLEQAIVADPSRTNELRVRQVQMYAEGGNCSEAQRLWGQISPTLATDDPYRAQYQQFVDNCRQVTSPLEQPDAVAAEKETWWPEDVEEMFSSFFDKLGIGDKASAEAQAVARETAAEAAGPTTLSEVAPSVVSTPSVSVEDTAAPWYVQYAPHMVIGGLGTGAFVMLVLYLKKRG